MRLYLLIIYSLLLCLMIVTAASAAEPCNYISCENRPGTYNVEVSNLVTDKSVYVPSWVITIVLPAEVPVAMGSPAKTWLKVKTPWHTYCYEADPSELKYVLTRRALGDKCSKASIPIEGPQFVDDMATRSMQVDIQEECKKAVCKSIIGWLELEVR